MSTLIAALIKAVNIAPPQASWALTNMIRNDHTSLASAYCKDDLLTPAILQQWLHHPPIATQTAWMIASLTGRESEVIMKLCRHQSFVSGLTGALRNPLATDQAAPLIQALGNLASDESLVPPLLTQTKPPLVPLLEQIIRETKSQGSGKDNALSLAAWLAGCLLVDAGMENHASTTVAAPVLIPALMDRLGSGRLFLEESREFAAALWNALARPPQMDEQEQQQHAQQQPMFHAPPGGFDFSNIASSKYPTPIRLPFAIETSQGVLRSLIRLAESNDTDGVLAAIHLLDLLLRRSQHYDSQSQQHALVQMMQEEGVPDTLDKVCDSGIDEAADIAAELYDDFFDGQE